MPHTTPRDLTAFVEAVGSTYLPDIKKVLAGIQAVIKTLPQWEAAGHQVIDGIDALNHELVEIFTDAVQSTVTAYDLLAGEAPLQTQSRAILNPKIRSIMDAYAVLREPI